MKKITLEWLKAAGDDLKVIEQIISEEDLSHIVAFHAQQSIEKTLKAIIEEYDLGLVKVHNLDVLFNIVKEKINYPINIILFEKLDKLYIDARYPGELGLLPNGKPTLKDANKFFNEAKNIHQHVTKHLTQLPESDD